MMSCAFLLVVVIALSGLSPASSQSWCWFQLKHIENAGSATPANYCFAQIRSREITDPFGRCKPQNTYIHAFPSTIKGLCLGTVGVQYVTSNNPYYLTNCVHHALSPYEMPPNCNYVATQYYKRIMIKCDGGVPVHLQAII